MIFLRFYATIISNFYLIHKAEQILDPYMTHCSGLTCSLFTKPLFLTVQ